MKSLWTDRRGRRVLRGVLALLAVAGSARGATADASVADAWMDGPSSEASSEAATAPVSGEALMAECLQRLPTEPVAMAGRLTMRRPRGMVSKTFDFSVDLNWGAEPPMARYVIREVSGPVVETVIARGGAAPELVRAAGVDNEPATSPEWNDRVQGSDVTWLDVTLAFLWWKSPRLAGEESLKGRLCDIVELEPPTPVPNCAKMRVWLDRELKLLMQAEEIDAAGRTTRRMWVRAVKKIHNRWMVRDLEVETRGSGHRTRLHIEDLVEPVAP